MFSQSFKVNIRILTFENVDVLLFASQILNKVMYAKLYY